LLCSYLPLAICLGKLAGCAVLIEVTIVVGVYDAAEAKVGHNHGAAVVLDQAVVGLEIAVDDVE